MKGLLYKDLVVNKKNIIIAVIFSIWFLICSVCVCFFNDSFDQVEFIVYNTIMNAASILIWIMVGLNSITNDEKCNWNKFSGTFPLSKREIMLSKYVYIIANSLVGVALSIVSIIGNAKALGMDLNYKLFIGLYIVYFLSVICMFVQMPLYIKYDSQKAGMLMIIVLVAITMIAFLLSYYGNSINLINIDGILENLLMDPEKTAKNALIISPIVAVITVLISFKLSCRFFKEC